MRFDTSQHMKLGQHMKLAPRMIQSMEILQMPLTELEERIEQELESNAALEQVEPQAETEEGDTSSAQDGRVRELQRDLIRRQDNGERDAKQDAMAAAPARADSLHDQLREQWRMSDVQPRIRELGDLIIGFLEDDGSLKTPLETIAERAPTGIPRPTVAELTDALRGLQLYLEPAGLAARDSRECLLSQLDAIEAGEGADGREASAGTVTDARLLVSEHLDDLMKNRLPRVSERTKLPMERIRAALEFMRKLSLSPGRALVTEQPSGIVPDAIVEYDVDGDCYIAYLNETRLPNLRVNREVALLARNKAIPKNDREFLRTNIGNAQWLIDAVQQRKQTLLRVIGVVLVAQRDFFDLGPQALKPLPMTQVAEQLGIHVATVSRAVADKYIQTPRGVSPLRKFFTGGVQTDSGEDVAWDAIKAALKEIVDAEDKAKPLSDDALADELKKRGIEIARRTVAKYRDQLNIPTAKMRKAY